MGSLSLLQGIFPTQGLNPGLPHLLPEPQGKPFLNSVSVFFHSIMDQAFGFDFSFQLIYVFISYVKGFLLIYVII